MLCKCSGKYIDIYFKLKITFSSYCFGCCQLLLRLLGVFLLLILVHLQFPLGVLRLAALLGFPCWLFFSEWQTVRETLHRGAGGGGWAPSSRPSGFRKWVPSPSGPSPAVLCPSIGRPGGAGVRRLGCRGAAAGLLTALPRHSSCSIVPIPMPFSSPISIPGAVLEYFSLVLVSKAALELAPLPSPGFYSLLFVVL